MRQTFIHLFIYSIFFSTLGIIKLSDKKWALSKFVWTDRPHGFTVPHVVLVAYVLGGSHMIARCHVQPSGLAHASIIRSLHIRRSSPWCNTSHGFVDNYLFWKSLIVFLQSKLLWLYVQIFLFYAALISLFISFITHLCDWTNFVHYCDCDFWSWMLDTSQVHVVP